MMTETTEKEETRVHKSRLKLRQVVKSRRENKEGKRMIETAKKRSRE